MSSPLPENEDSRLESLHGFRILGTSCEQAFDDILRLATLICDTPIGKIGFVDEQRVWLKAKIGLEFNEIPRERSFSAHAILRPDILLVRDPIADATFANNLLVTEMGVRFFAGMPLITTGHQAIGAISVMDRVPHFMTEEQIDSLQILARRIMHELAIRCTGDAPSQHHGLHLEPPHHRSVTILIVEDNDNLRNLLQRTLEGVGFSAFPAVDGAEALRWCEQHEGTIEIVVSDIVMPELNGLEFSKRIRVTHPETKFLFITGFGNQFSELGEYGANILGKPFLPSELVRKVEDILNRGQAVTGTRGP
ncbi:MAG: response regulator [Terriglobales bacterium]